MVSMVYHVYYEVIMRIARKGRFALNRMMRNRRTGGVFLLDESLPPSVFGVLNFDADRPYLFPISYEEIPQSWLLNRRLYTVIFSKWQRRPQIKPASRTVLTGGKNESKRMVQCAAN